MLPWLASPSPSHRADATSPRRHHQPNLTCTSRRGFQTLRRSEEWRRQHAASDGRERTRRYERNEENQETDSCHEQMMAATPWSHEPPGLIHHGDRRPQDQQPTLAPNRTRNQRPLPTNPHSAPTLHTAGHPGSGPGSGPGLGRGTSSTSRASSRSEPTPDLHTQHQHQHQGRHHQHPHPHSHQHPHPGYSIAPPQHSGQVGQQPLPWAMYGAADPTSALNPTAFDFGMQTVVPTMSAVPHSLPADPATSFGADFIPPTTFYDTHPFAYTASWPDRTGPVTSTETLTAPALAPVPTTSSSSTPSNPWRDPDEDQEDFIGETSQAKGKPRHKRPKRSARGAGEGQAGPSTGDPASPSTSYSQNSRASLGSKTTSIASTSTNSSRPSRLRSASRTSKNTHHKPADSPEERRTRASHNLVEKQYRNRLNAQFESLLGALPEQVRSGGDGEESEGPMDFGDRRVSKGEVLDLARRHIQSLERERDQLEREKNELVGSLERLKQTAPADVASPSQETQIEFNINMDDAEDEETEVEGEGKDKSKDKGKGKEKEVIKVDKDEQPEKGAKKG